MKKAVYHSQHMQLTAVAILLLAEKVTSIAGDRCTNGLPSNGTLENFSLMPSSDVQDQRQYIFPNIGFLSGCSGNITKWKFAAFDWDINGNTDPEIQLWRPNDVGTEYTRVASTTIRILSSTTARQVYSYNIDPPLAFQGGDVLGVFSPRRQFSHLRMLFQTISGDNAPLSRYLDTRDPQVDSSVLVTSSTDIPLINAEIEIDNPLNEDNCAMGFVTDEQLRLAVASVVDNQLRIIPGINFTCSGEITKWTLAGEWAGNNRVLYPVLQIWRASGMTIDSFVEVNSTELIALTEMTSNVYSGTVDPPIPFLAGDVVGLYIPDGTTRFSGGQLRVFFELDFGPANYVFLSDQDTIQLVNSEMMEAALPLISLDIVSSLAISSTSTTHPQPTDTVSVSSIPSSTSGGPIPSSTSGGPIPSSASGGAILSSASGGPIPSSLTSGIQNTSSASVGPIPSSASGGPIPSSASGGPIPSSTSEGPIPSSTSEGPIPSSTSEGPIPSSTSDGPVPSSTSEGPIPSSTSEGPIPSSTSEGPIPSSASESPIPSSTSEGPIPSSTSEGPIPSSTSEGPIPSSTSEGPIPSSTSEGPIPSSTSEGPIPSSTSEGPIPSSISGGPIPSSASESLIPSSAFMSDSIPTKLSTVLPTDPTSTIGPGSSSGLTTGVSVGIVLFVVLIVVLFIVTLLLVLRRRGRYKFPDRVLTNVLANPVYSPVEGLALANGHSTHKADLIAMEGDYAEPDSDFSLVNKHAESGRYEKDFDNPLYTDPDPQLDESRFDNSIYSAPCPTAITNISIPTCGVYVPTQSQREDSMIPLDSLQDVTNAGMYSTLYATMNEVDTPSFFKETDTYWAPSSEPSELYDQLARYKYREILVGQMEVSQCIGTGQFGIVQKGVWKAPDGPVDVAIKTLNNDSTEEDKIKFLQEAAINGQFHHRSIISLYGVVTLGSKPMIVLELMKGGDMKDYLPSQKYRISVDESASQDVALQYLDFCYQIASGMKYLSDKLFVHRDLAARNILVSDDGQQCKISDFGMARDIQDSDYYISQGGKIPVKWTAPEALNYKKYSSASDVWGFGVVMYEIWSFGCKPFDGVPNMEVIRQVMSGYRLPPPPGCPRSIYQKMMECWHPTSKSRPAFGDLLTFFGQAQSVLLKWNVTDKAVHPQASVLGAPLESGYDLYPELQSMYK